MNVVYNMDCLEAMRKMPDNAFDLAVVDPPYGDATERRSTTARHYAFGVRKSSRNYQNRRNMGSEIRKKIISWDVAPENEYFDELFRVSRNQIIWGGNYFDLPPTRCFIIFRKTNIPEKGFSMAPVEYAWTSFNRNAEIIEAFKQGRPGEERFHPTQKPVYLYAEIFNRFAKPGMKILDTHLGSGSSRIAAYDAGLDFVGYEIDEVYFRKAEERFQKHIEQMDLFHMDEPEKAEQMDLFDIIGGEA